MSKKIKDLHLAPMEEIEQVVAPQETPTFPDIKIIGHCETCAFWGIYRDFTCDAIGLSSINEFDESLESISNKMASISVTINDDSGLEAELKTGPKFSCLLYECK